MTPPTSQAPKNLARLIGSAKKLLFLLVEYAPTDWTDDTSVYISGGNIVTDADLGELLNASLETVARWRRTLRTLGLIDWLSDGRQGRVLRVAAGTRAIVDALKYGGQKPEPTKGVGPAREWVQ